MKGWKRESARHSLAARGIPTKSLQYRLAKLPVQYGGVSKNLYKTQVLCIYEMPGTSRRIMWVKVMPGQKKEGNIYMIEKTYIDTRTRRETIPSNVHNLETFEVVGERIGSKTTQKSMKKTIQELISEGWVEKYDHKSDLSTSMIEFHSRFE